VPLNGNECDPVTTMKDLSDDGRPSYLVHGKLFCCHRGRRPDAIDPQTGERLDDVLMFRVADEGVKELLVADDRGLFFTTPHFDGYAAVLIRIPELSRVDRTKARRQGVARRPRGARGLRLAALRYVCLYRYIILLWHEQRPRQMRSTR
jgi:hypothetical protein